jgi:hypothetical protein
MKRIGVEINGVLRDTVGKFKNLYEKYLIDCPQFDDNTYEVSVDLISGGTIEVSESSSDLIENNKFEYKVLGEVTSLELDKYFNFRDKDELYSFMYEEYTMELFGHSSSSEMNSFNLLNEFYYDNRDEFDVLIVSDEIGKSKPASLFFLSKFGCLVEQILFYSEITKLKMWDGVDILVTSNPDLILNKPTDKTVIKYVTDYNKHVYSEYKIHSLSELNETIKNIKNDVFNLQ